MLTQPNESFAPMLCASAPKVLIAVCSYKRPQMLEACLSSLIGQETDYSFQYAIAVVDNDPAMSAHSVTCLAALAVHETVVHYLHEPVRGIARARNKALKYARQMGFSYLAFIDDDEVADSKWIANLMHSDYLGVPFLAGRNIINYANIPEWAAPKSKPANPEHEGKQIDHAGTGNVRLGPKIVLSPMLFDESLGLGGGEDSDFFRRAGKYKLEGRQTLRAITIEFAHPERMTIWGQCNRTFWITAVNMRLDMRHRGEWRGALRKLPTALTSIPYGSFFILGGLFTCLRDETRGKRKILKGAKIIAKGQGYLAGMVGHIPQSYTKTVGA